MIKQFFFYLSCAAIFVNIVLFFIANYTGDFSLSMLSIINILLLSMVFFTLAEK